MTARAASAVEDDIDDRGGQHAPSPAASEPESGPSSSTRQGVDDSVLAILREEAEREADARLSDARPLETQQDLGVDQAVGLTPTQRRMAMLSADDTAPSAAKPAARRDLLPDVEEINSTLQPSDQGQDPSGAVDNLPDLTRSKGGFRSGFLTMMTIAIIGLSTYLAAPELAARFPSLAGPLGAYVGFVNSMRVQVDGLMQAATSAINGDGS